MSRVLSSCYREQNLTSLNSHALSPQMLLYLFFLENIACYCILFTGSESINQSINHTVARHGTSTTGKKRNLLVHIYDMVPGPAATYTHIYILVEIFALGSTQLVCKHRTRTASKDQTRVCELENLLIY